MLARRERRRGTNMLVRFPGSVEKMGPSTVRLTMNELFFRSKSHWRSADILKEEGKSYKCHGKSQEQGVSMTDLKQCGDLETERCV
jgi:hypothetical protein